MSDHAKANNPISAFLNLRYLDADGTLAALPKWATFFIDLGNFVGQSHCDLGEKLVVGLTLPSRSFASGFAAVGTVIGSLRGYTETRTDEEYFEYLCSLPKNTPIKHRDINRKGRSRLFDGIILGTQEMSGQKMLKIQREKASMIDSTATGLTCYIQLNRCRDISIPSAEDGISIDRLPTSQKGTRMASTSRFLRAIIGDGLIASFESESAITSLIVGATTVLDTELTEQRFFTDGGVEGTLSELLRVKRLLPPGSPYRSNIFATNSRRPPRYNDDLVPSVVIFDGAQGFLKWRDRFPLSHWLVLLDSTSPNFESGRNELNNRYLQRSETEPSLDSFPVLPDGVEMIVFLEKNQ